jgi:predicted transcriptional regulator
MWSATGWGRASVAKLSSSRQIDAGLRSGSDPMSHASAKELLKEAVEQLPPDATVEDAMERLYFLAKIEKGLEDAAAGRTLSHEEVGRRLGL